MPDSEHAPGEARLEGSAAGRRRLEPALRRRDWPGRSGSHAGIDHGVRSHPVDPQMSCQGQPDVPDLKVIRFDSISNSSRAQGGRPCATIRCGAQAEG